MVPLSCPHLLVSHVDTLKGDVQKARIAGIVNHAETAPDTNPEEGDVIASSIRFKVLIEFGVAPTGEGIECATEHTGIACTRRPHPREHTIQSSERKRRCTFSTMCIQHFDHVYTTES